MLKSSSGKTRTPVGLGVILLSMTVLVAYSPTPYQLFCAVTGYGGTTQRADANLKGIIGREMTTRFDATVSSGLPVHVRPSRPVADAIGTARTITFTATNPTAREITMTASFNVTPELAGVYFNKIECFCFTEQLLAPGERRRMPVRFIVDPALPDTIDTLTLS